MEVFDTIGAEGCEIVQLSNSDDYEVLFSLEGGSRSETWKPLKASVVSNDQGRALKAADFPWLGCPPWVVRPSVVQCLKPILLQYGELLSIDCESDGPLWVYNVTNVLDALDEESSELSKYSDGRIMSIQRIAFVNDTVEGNDIFRLPHRGSSIFVSQRFVGEVNRANLVGMDFKRVWP